MAAQNPWRALSAASIVIAVGLVLRRYGYELGLSFFPVKYGGSFLWGAMVFWLVTMLLHRQPIRRVVLVSAAIAIAVELSRLYHQPWLDAFRLTTAGALLLGRVFSPWNILAYLLGIAAAAAVEMRLLRYQRVGKDI